MGKMVVLKPVLWNSQGYRGPTGGHRSSGYADDHGYGHEEWNGRPDWVWKGWRVFHTQGRGRMFEHAQTGDLGILMTVVISGRFHAVGVGCNVYQNSEEEMAELARDLDLINNADEVWAIEDVRKRKTNRRAFDRHWRQAHKAVNWKCPQSHYLWFEEPVPFVPNDIIPETPPREATVKMHSSYQAVRPDQALAIVDPVVPPEHPIRGWLLSGNFDPVRNRSVQRAPAPKAGGKSAGAPGDSYSRYLQENEVFITPKHRMLQAAFERYLRGRKATDIKPDIQRVDVRFNHPRRGLVLAEIKPTEPSTARFAIRAAMGQLLDYRQRCAAPAELLIVVSGKPDDAEDIALAHVNGFGLAWQQGKDFEVSWPPA